MVVVANVEAVEVALGVEEEEVEEEEVLEEEEEVATVVE